MIHTAVRPLVLSSMLLVFAAQLGATTTPPDVTPDIGAPEAEIAYQFAVVLRYEYPDSSTASRRLLYRDNGSVCVTPLAYFCPPRSATEPCQARDLPDHLDVPVCTVRRSAVRH